MMPDKLTALNIRVSGFLPAWCPACGTWSINNGAQGVSIENVRAVGWSFRPIVECIHQCGVLAKPLPTGDDYELYAPEHLIPKLVARKLRGELRCASQAEVDKLEAYRQIYGRQPQTSLDQLAEIRKATDSFLEWSRPTAR